MVVAVQGVAATSWTRTAHAPLLDGVGCDGGAAAVSMLPPRNWMKRLRDAR